MDLHSARPFWPVQDGLPRTYAPLEADAECDVLVVGAGITGAFVAYELASQGYDVLVLDRRDVAAGSTAASTALIQYEVDAEFAGLRKYLGQAGAETTYRRMAAGTAAVLALAKRLGGCGVAISDSLYFASRLAHVPRLQAEFVARQTLGLAVEWLEGSALNVYGGTRRPAAIRSQKQGSLDPYLLAHALLGSHKRIRVCDRTAVTKVDYGRTRIRATTDRSATVRADHVVYATGYETHLHARTFPQQRYETYALVSEPGATGLPSPLVFWETGRPYFYGRTTPDGRFMMGGFNDRHKSPEQRDRLVAKRTRQLEAAAKRMFPAAAFETAYAWAGSFGDTQDSLPYVGADPEHARGWFLLGYGANGVVFAKLGSEMIADGIEGKPMKAADFMPARSRGRTT